MGRKVIFVGIAVTAALALPSRFPKDPELTPPHLVYIDSGWDSGEGVSRGCTRLAAKVAVHVASEK